MEPFEIGKFAKAVPRPRDDRDWKGESFLLTGGVAPVPPITLDDYIYMQSQQPACGGHAGASVMNDESGVVTSPEGLWDFIKQIDNLPPEDGTDIRSIFKAMQAKGVPSLALLPNNVDLSVADYASANNLTPGIIADAATRLITNYAFTENPTLAQINQAISQYKSVILRVACGTGWYTSTQGNISWAEQDVLPLRLGTAVSGHFIKAKYIDNEGNIWGPNSWSAQWGHQGYYYFNASYLPYVYEMGIPLTYKSAQFIFHSDLYLTLQSSDVLQLQIRLDLPEANRTGYFGLITEGAVKEYQLANDIPPTGYVGPLTRASLNKPLIK